MENKNVFLNHKRISNKLPLLGIAFVIIIAVGFLLKDEPKYKYKVSTEATLERILERNDVMRPDLFTEVYNKKDSSYRFIDLRSAHDFLQGHLPGAINIPVGKLLNEENQNRLNQGTKTNVLYYSDQCGACGPLILLTELGYENIILLGGGYDYVKANIIDSTEPTSVDFRSEKARYDYAEIVKETGGAVISKSATTVVAPPTVIKKKKKMDDEGGC